MKPILIIKTGSSFGSLAQEKGDFDDWVAQGLGLSEDEVLSVDVFANDLLPDPEEVSGAVITGSHAMVSDREPWSEYTASWLRVALDKDLPILGICFGHQLLAHACGGRVDYHPAGREVGTVSIELDKEALGDPLFAALAPSFYGHVTHSQTVIELPRNAVCLARNAHEPYHAFRIGLRAWGVQFHPEFDEMICRHYIQAQAEALIAENKDPLSLQNEVRPTPRSANLLARFVSVCAEGECGFC
jgi:GMP synthase (glutamine-hydrolysing)